MSKTNKNSKEKKNKSTKRSFSKICQYKWLFITYLGLWGVKENHVESHACFYTDSMGFFSKQSEKRNNDIIIKSVPVALPALKLVVLQNLWTEYIQVLKVRLKL